MFKCARKETIIRVGKRYPRERLSYNRLLKGSRDFIFGYRESLITDIFAWRTPDPSFSIAETTTRVSPPTK